MREESGKKTYYYWDNGTGTYRLISSSGNYSSIRVIGAQYELTRKDKTVYFFDAVGKLQSITDKNYNTITLSYTGNNLTTVSDSFGRTISITYEQGKIADISDPASRVTHIAYDANGYLSSVVDPAGNTRVYVYSAERKMLSKTDQIGNITTYAYDAYGRVTAATNSSGTKNIAYGTGNSVTITERDGGVWTYTYDSRYSVPLEVVGSNNTRTTYVYDDNRNLISWTDSEGNSTSYTYDSYGNILTMTDPMNNTATYTYEEQVHGDSFVTKSLQGNENPWGQVTSITDANGNITRFGYNYNGNLLSVSDPLGNTSTMRYNYYGELESQTDANGKSTYYTYDSMGRLNTVTDPLGNMTSYAYTEDDNISAVTDAQNHVISYGYDSLGRVIQMTDQLGNTETYTYDNYGNIITVTNRKGQTTAYTYDSMNRLTSATYANGSSMIYTYDTLGRLTAINDSVSGEISYEYASANCGSCGGGSSNKIIKETTPLGSISYTYDSLGRRTSMTVTGQQPVNYTYDANSHMTGINTHINGVSARFGFSHDVLGRKTSLTFPNGVTTNYSFDNGNRLLNLEHINPFNSVFESIGYSYDANGNRTSIDRPSVNLPAPVPVSDIFYNEANQMFAFDAENITYDANGNMTSVTNSCGTTTYTWDARNRLVGITGFKPHCTALTASFTYDALGRRIAKTINGRTIQYLYDGKDVVQEIENGAVTVNYIRTLNIDEPLARIESSGTVRYYHADALGSIIALTDATGTEVTQYSYEPFGRVTISGEISDNPFQYTGRENDGTGLYYYRARYYFPKLQRFISEDPIGLAGGINLFAYVSNNPVNLIDPTGLAGCGPGTIGDWLVPDDWPSYSFGKCCNEHDDCYGCKGGSSKADCDEKFCKCMLKQCETLYGDSKRSCEGNAKLYCSMVKKYGGPSFKNGRK